MTYSPFPATLALLAALAVPAQGQLIVPADEVEFEPHITGQGEKMNYGPFLSYTLFGVGKESKGKVNMGLLAGKIPPLFMRPINIHLGGKCWACFDTEMCAFGCAWSGGPPNISRSNLNGYKGADLAYLQLPALFQNQVRPGWSLDGHWKDPRPTPYGALPKKLAHYQGLYLHQGMVILQYSLGQAKVLDLPVQANSNPVVFGRQLRLENLNQPAAMFVADNIQGTWKVNRAGNLAILAGKTVDLWVGLECESPGVALNGIQEGIVINLPARKKPLEFRLFIGQGKQSIEGLQKLRGGAQAFDLPALCMGGPPRWKETLTLPGQLGNNDAAYTVDTIPLPFKNPWNSWMRPGGFDFFKDGRVALCTWNGDVWVVSGLDADLKKVTWKRFATGLFEPMGLRILDDFVYVLGRDQITKLHDLNNDGEADFYENFNNDAPTAASYHSFALELHTDTDGNFYYLRGAHRIPAGTPLHGGMIKVAKDGGKAELICTGIREANGMSIGPNGTITAADNQGNWVPSSRIDFIRPGKFYGYRWGKEKDYPPAENPLCWIPMKEDNSSGGQAWVNSNKWGPLENDLLHTSYGTAKLFQVLYQRDGDRAQGGVTPFALDFKSGIMRARFSPLDGQLYVCGLKGWSTQGKDDGCLQRVRYTGKPLYRPKAMRVDKGQIAISFTDPIDPSSVKLDNIKVEQWNYRWTASYGSKDYSVANPKMEGRDLVLIKQATLQADRKTVVLQIPTLQPVMQMSITLRLNAADGQAFSASIYPTINYLP